VTLRIVAEHADIWHAFGDPATMRRKSKILDEWCAKVGRDPSEIQRSTTIARLTGETRNPDDYLEIGLTDFVVSVQGPDWDLAPLRRALTWRESVA
jgi:alkanesulfonate monooxygenase SsuD/methylene tetrahydromethanopterin reductase-like flavin-dependent oxidoreductase (luciferase family)